MNMESIHLTIIVLFCNNNIIFKEGSSMREILEFPLSSMTVKAKWYTHFMAKLKKKMLVAYNLDACRI